MHLPKLALASLLVLYGGCNFSAMAQEDSEPLENLSQIAGIDFYVPSDRNLFLNMFADSIKRYSKEHKLAVEVIEAENNHTTQLEQIKRSFKIDHANLIRTVDINDAPKIVDQAQLVHGTLIFVNLPPSEGVLKPYAKAWSVSSDKARLGTQQGEQIVEYLRQHGFKDKNGNGVIDILMLQGIKGHPDTILRTKGALAELKKASFNFKVTDSFTGNWYYEPAFEHVAKLIKNKSFKNIDLIISNNDDMALGALDAIEQNLGETEDAYVPTFGIDGIPDALEAIRDERMVATVKQDMQTMAKVALNIALGHTDFAELSKLVGRKVQSRLIFVNNLKLDKHTIDQTAP